MMYSSGDMCQIIAFSAADALYEFKRGMCNAYGCRRVNFTQELISLERKLSRTYGIRSQGLVIYALQSYTHSLGLYPWTWTYRG